MELASVFDPTTATSGQFTASTLQTGSTMIVINKSYVDVIFTFSSGDQRLVIANDRRAFVFADASSVPGPLIKWAQENIDYPQTINQLQNIVYVEIYSPTEKVAETYPSNVQRETLPSLIPYDIGHGSYWLNGLDSATPNPVIWPSSYYGVTCAPQSIGGMGFDHFYIENVIGVSNVMPDLPGQYSTTGKTANNATLQIPSSTTLANVPGPFSSSGLPPIDSATFTNQNFWTLASAIPWGSSTGFTIDAWINPLTYNQFLFGDDNPRSTNKGLFILLDINGHIEFSVGNGSTGITLGSNATIPIDVWTYVACRWDKVNGNLEIWINGTRDSVINFPGTPANTTVLPSIGLDTASGGPSWAGIITDVGVILSDINATQWGVNAVNARYLLGLQSLNTDFQQAWLDGAYFSLTALFAGSATDHILNGIYNPAGLLYSPIPSKDTILHVFNTANAPSLRWDWPSTTQGQVLYQTLDLPKPLTHFKTAFMSFDVSHVSSATTNLEIMIHGYNILGFK